MKNYRKIDDVITEIAVEQIEKRRKNPTASLIILILGLAMLASTYYVDAIRMSGMLSNAMFLIGIVATGLGLIKAIVDFTSRRRLYYKPSGTELRRYELLFDMPYLWKVCQCVNDGDLASLAGIPHSDSSPVKAVIYKTADNDVVMTQAFESQRPLTETRFFQKGAFTFTERLMK